jgi:hypothetical protein
MSFKSRNSHENMLFYYHEIGEDGSIGSLSLVATARFATYFIVAEKYIKKCINQRKMLLDHEKIDTEKDCKSIYFLKKPQTNEYGRTRNMEYFLCMSLLYDGGITHDRTANWMQLLSPSVHSSRQSTSHTNQDSNNDCVESSQEEAFGFLDICFDFMHYDANVLRYFIAVMKGDRATSDKQRKLSVATNKVPSLKFTKRLAEFQLSTREETAVDAVVNSMLISPLYKSSVGVLREQYIPSVCETGWCQEGLFPESECVYIFHEIVDIIHQIDKYGHIRSLMCFFGERAMDFHAEGR